MLSLYLFLFLFQGVVFIDIKFASEKQVTVASPEPFLIDIGWAGYVMSHFGHCHEKTRSRQGHHAPRPTPLYIQTAFVSTGKYRVSHLVRLQHAWVNR
jgi:hypothetical protein